VFAIWGHEKAAEMTYYGLHALQHRGQEGAGIVTTDNNKLHMHKGIGLINDVFSEREFSKLTGHAAIGHVRYTTNGGRGFENVQPLVFPSQKTSMALCHNGNLVNAHALRNQLEAQGSILQTTSDTEIIAHLIKRSGNVEMEDAIITALSMVKGAYAFSLLTENQLFIGLDPRGLRPLSIGRLGEAYVVASETCAFDLIGATYEREVQPGELIIIDEDGFRTRQFTSPLGRTLCS